MIDGGIAMKKTTVEWHPYPQERPTEDKFYLVTIKYKRTSKVDIWDSVNGYFYIEGVLYDGNEVIAWAEMPGPYKEENI